MMDEDHTENGHISKDGNEELESEKLEDLNTATAASTNVADSMMEYFELKTGGSETGSERESPRLLDKDNDSHHSNSYVTVSPPVSPYHIVDLANGKEDTETEQSTTNLHYTPEEVVKSKPQSRTRSADMENALSRHPLPEPDAGQDSDLKVSITDRENITVKSKDGFVSYKISTETSRQDDVFKQSSYVVWRRYKDFEWLREMLEKHNPTLIIPPIPGKQLARYFDQRSEEFLNERQKALDKFLKRISAHSFLSFSKYFKMFIAASATEFASFMAKTSGSSRLLGTVTSSVKMATSSFLLKNADPAFVKEAKYFEDLGDKLGHIERIASRLHSECEEFGLVMEDFSAALTLWSLNERQLENPINKMGTCVENCTNALKTLNESNAQSLIMSAREYQLYCAAGMSAIRQRNNLQLAKERAGEEREKRKKVHEEAVSAGKLQKLPKLAEDLQKSSAEAEKTLDDLSKANEQLRVDIEKWKESKDRELCKLMSVGADNYITYHQKCFDEWEAVLSLLRTPKSSPAILSELESSASESVRQELVGVATPKTLGDVDLERSGSPDLFT